jgi:hypothetical protein
LFVCFMFLFFFTFCCFFFFFCFLKMLFYNIALLAQG